MHHFWQSHNPKRNAWSQQYKAIILYQNNRQFVQAQQSLKVVSASITASVTTEIQALDRFYLAEEYHQKYRLQSSPLMDEFKKIYPNSIDWINSTAAARVNSYLSGYGLETLNTDIKRLGLSEAGERILKKSLPRQSAACPLP